MRLHFGSIGARSVAVVLALLAVLLLPALASAQSASDKATARKLAIEGIELYKATKYSEALDKLQRAEALYDAPIHVVYIARCQAELGQYVEAAENYRKLTRTRLDDNAPDAFKEAVADAKKELPNVEPKIASLTIDVKPAGIEGLKLAIDGVAVSSAVVGEERPTNPGSRKLTASAPGYKEFETTVELKPGDKKSVSVELVSDGGAGATAGTSEGKGAGTGEHGAGDNGNEGKTTPAEPASPIGFLFGLRVGGALTGGQVVKDQAMSDYFGSAGMAEIRGGVRFFQHYTALLFGSVYGYQAGGNLKKLPGSQSRADTRPVGTDAGVGFMYSAEPGKLGPFAELDLLFVHRFEASRDLTINTGGGVVTAERCTQTLKAIGSGIRLGGGVQIPLNDWLQLSPFGSFTLGQIGDLSVNDGCRFNKNAGLANTPWASGYDFTQDQKATHFVVTLGIGGDLVFGKDKTAK